MYCVHCGVQHVDDANFCSNCGRELSHNSAEEVVESSTDEPESEVRVHHPWMPVQQQPQEQVQEEPNQVHHPWMPTQQQDQAGAQEQVRVEPQTQAQGEVPQALNALKSILRRVNGWSERKKILWGIVAFFLFLICVGVVIAEPVEDAESEASATDGQPVAETENSASTTDRQPLDPPDDLFSHSERKDNHGWQEKGEKVMDHYWYSAEELCTNDEGKYPEFSEQRFNEVIDAASASAKNLGIAMPSDSKLTNLHSVYTGSLASSDTWTDAYFTNRDVYRMFTRGADSIAMKKFGTINNADSRKIAWLKENDGSPERAQYQQYLFYVFMLEHWFNCGTAALQ